MTLDRNLEQDFIRVTEQAAIAAARTMGLGDRQEVGPGRRRGDAA